MDLPESLRGQSLTRRQILSAFGMLGATPVANPEIMAATDHVLPYFTAFRNPLSPLYTKAFTPTFPNDFSADVASGGLPSVSWVIPPLGFDEHPSSAPANGMYFTSLVLDALTSNPAARQRMLRILVTFVLRRAPIPDAEVVWM